MHKQWVNAIRFSPDDRLLLTGSDDHEVLVWSTHTWRPVLALEARDWVGAVGIGPGGDFFAVGAGKELTLYPLNLSGLGQDPLRVFKRAQRAAGMRLEGFKLDVTRPPREP